MERIININNAQFIGISNYLNTAYKDYIASRVLLNAGQLYRGVIIANTTIEKYLKAYSFVSGVKKGGHDASKLLTTIEKFDPNLKDIINKDFVKFISKAYPMRYFDIDLFSKPNKSFYLCVPQYKTLAELDFTVDVLLNSLNIYKGNIMLQSMYNDDLDERNPHLYDNNYILQKVNKTKFIEVKQQVYEIKSGKGQQGVFEIYRKTANVKDDGIFNFEESYFDDFDSKYQQFKETMA